MEDGIPSKLSELFGADLAGWQIRYCHFLSLDHGLMGTFPALLSEGSEPVVAFDRRSLRHVYNALPRRSAKVTSLLCAVNPALKIAFNLRVIDLCGDDIRPFRIHFDAELEALSKQPGVFRWASGLINGDGFIREPDFGDGGKGDG